MRFMIVIKATKDFEAGIPPSPELVAGMAALSEEMMRAGVLLATEGLQPSSAGLRVHYSAGRCTVKDGPFTESKELIGGFAIVRADSREEVLELANRAMEVHIRAGVPALEMEIRPLFEPGNTCPPRP